MDEQNPLMKSLKNLHKSSSMGPLLELIDNGTKKKVKPPKAPKHMKMSYKENILMNIENLDMNRLRSRQPPQVDNKPLTIQHSPKKDNNLELKNSTKAMHRKRSFVDMKTDTCPLNLNFSKSKRLFKKNKIKKSLQKAVSVGKLNLLRNSENEINQDDSFNDFKVSINNHKLLIACK